MKKLLNLRKKISLSLLTMGFVPILFVPQLSINSDLNRESNINQGNHNVGDIIKKNNKNQNFNISQTESENFYVEFKVNKVSQNTIFGENDNFNGQVSIARNKSQISTTNTVDIKIPSLIQDENGFVYSVTEITDRAFSETSVQNVTIEKPEKIESIGDYAFFNCEKFVSFPLNDCININKIGEEAFRKCENLNQFGISSNPGVLTFSNKLERIGMSSFDSCKKLNEVDFTNSIIEEIPNNSFVNCNNLSVLKLNNITKKIGDSAFANTKIQQLRLNSSVVNIGSYAFSNAFNDQGSSLVIDNVFSNITIGQNAFKNMTPEEKNNSNLKISVPKNSVEDFSNTTFLNSIGIDSSNQIEQIPYTNIWWSENNKTEATIDNFSTDNIFSFKLDADIEFPDYDTLSFQISINNANYQSIQKGQINNFDWIECQIENDVINLTILNIPTDNTTNNIKIKASSTIVSATPEFNFNINSNFLFKIDGEKSIVAKTRTTSQYQYNVASANTAINNQKVVWSLGKNKFDGLVIDSNGQIMIQDSANSGTHDDVEVIATLNDSSNQEISKSIFTISSIKIEDDPTIDIELSKSIPFSTKQIDINQSIEQKFDISFISKSNFFDPLASNNNYSWEITSYSTNAKYNNLLDKYWIQSGIKNNTLYGEFDFNQIIQDNNITDGFEITYTIKSYFRLDEITYQSNEQEFKFQFIDANNPSLSILNDNSFNTDFLNNNPISNTYYAQAFNLNEALSWSLNTPEGINSDLFVLNTEENNSVSITFNPTQENKINPGVYTLELKATSGQLTATKDIKLEVLPSIKFQDEQNGTLLINFDKAISKDYQLHSTILPSGNFNTSYKTNNLPTGFTMNQSGLIQVDSQTKNGIYYFDVEAFANMPDNKQLKTKVSVIFNIIQTTQYSIQGDDNISVSENGSQTTQYSVMDLKNNNVITNSKVYVSYTNIPNQSENIITSFSNGIFTIGIKNDFLLPNNPIINLEATVQNQLVAKKQINIINYNNPKSIKITSNIDEIYINAGTTSNINCLTANIFEQGCDQTKKSWSLKDSDTDKFTIDSKTGIISWNGNNTDTSTLTVVCQSTITPSIFDELTIPFNIITNKSFKLNSSSDVINASDKNDPNHSTIDISLEDTNNNNIDFDDLVVLQTNLTNKENILISKTSDNQFSLAVSNESILLDNSFIVIGAKINDVIVAQKVINVAFDSKPTNIEIDMSSSNNDLYVGENVSGSYSGLKATIYNLGCQQNLVRWSIVEPNGYSLQNKFTINSQTGEISWNEKESSISTLTVKCESTLDGSISENLDINIYYKSKPEVKRFVTPWIWVILTCIIVAIASFGIVFGFIVKKKNKKR